MRLELSEEVNREALTQLQQAEIANKLIRRRETSPGCLRPQDEKCDCPPCGGPND